MADAQSFVFISYPAEPEDRVVVIDLIEALRDHGIVAWYDGNILPGDDWEAAIRDHHKRAVRVVGLFTRNSRRADDTNRAVYWSEINRAMTEKRLIPVRLDKSELSLGVDTYQFADLERDKMRADNPAIDALATAIKNAMVSSGATVGIREDEARYLAMLVDCQESEGVLRDQLLERVKLADARVAVFVIVTNECQSHHAVWARFEQDYVAQQLPSYRLETQVLLGNFARGRDDVLLRSLRQAVGLESAVDVRQTLVERAKPRTVLALYHDSELGSETLQGLHAWLEGWRATKLPEGCVVALLHRVQVKGLRLFRQGKVRALRETVEELFGERGGVVEEAEGIFRPDGIAWLQVLRARRKNVHAYSVEDQLDKFFAQSKRANMTGFVMHFGKCLQSILAER